MIAAGYVDLRRDAAPVHRRVRALPSCLVMLLGCRTLLDLESPQLEGDAGQDGVRDALASTDASTSTDAMDASGFGCPTSYATLAGSQYRLVTTSLTWPAAAASCSGHGVNTHLAVIANESERTLLLAAFGGTGAYRWIGLTDNVTEAAYRWVTDENTLGYPPATGAPWQIDEPDGGTNENCAAMNSGGELESRPCTVTFSYICECDAHLNDPTNY